jgi:hypothetical protein
VSVEIVDIQPTFTPYPDEGVLDVGGLPLGQEGNYVNVTYGFWMQYPPSWHTGFGRRPLLASFSDLDPGTHNRESMRDEGCLIEINVSSNLFGFTPEQMMAQVPKGFAHRESFDLDGEKAIRVRLADGKTPFEGEWVLASHGESIYRLTYEHARGSGEIYRQVWEKLLSTWQWFEPDFVAYLNPKFGYSFSHPRSWYRFSEQDRGISISSHDPTGVTDLAALLTEAMVVKTNVYENPENLPLKDWLATQDTKPDLTNDVSIDGLRGIRTLKESDISGMEEMIGYFQGPLGKIYEVKARYPVDTMWEFRPIANAIIYSFSF